jgi:hypothetical protein
MVVAVLKRGLLAPDFNLTAFSLAAPSQAALTLYRKG